MVKLKLYNDKFSLSQVCHPKFISGSHFAINQQEALFQFLMMLNRYRYFSEKRKR